MSCNMNPYSNVHTLMICATNSPIVRILRLFLDLLCFSGFTTMFLESSIFTPDDTPEQLSSDMTKWPCVLVHLLFFHKLTHDR